MGILSKFASTTGKLFEFILPTKSSKAGGTSVTDTYKSGNTEVLSAPTYREHLNDIYSTRTSSDAQTLLKELFRTDPDCSAAVNAYLTTSNTDLIYTVKDSTGEYSQDGARLLQQTIDRITRRNDYTLGYQPKSSINGIRESLKYMLLLRGAVGAELIFDKMMLPSEIRNVDMYYVKWYEKKPGEFKPQQETTESGEKISLDIPTFFTSTFRQDPTSPYTYSYFVSAINVIAARQQVINDLYRIMNVTGFPRIDLTVMEETVVKNAPSNIKDKPEELKKWVTGIVQGVANSFNGVAPDQPFSHTDSIQAKMINDKNPGGSLQIEDIIATLNAQNQAGLKAVSAFLGRGNSGVNTATVEAQVFAMNAQELNEPIDYILSEVFTLALRIQGFDGIVEIKSRPVNLKPEIELEAQTVMKQSRLLEELSLGLISDEEYHLKMEGRIPLWNYPKLSGTNFRSNQVNTADVSPNSDPLGRAITPDDDASARSNTIKTTTDREKGKDVNK